MVVITAATPALAGNAHIRPRSARGKRTPPLVRLMDAGLTSDIGRPERKKDMYKLFVYKDISKSNQASYVKSINQREKALRNRNAEIILLKKEIEVMRMTIARLTRWYANAAVVPTTDAPEVTVGDSGSVSENLTNDTCPRCKGDGERLWDDGLMHDCAHCKGTGKVTTDKKERGLS